MKQISALVLAALVASTGCTRIASTNASAPGSEGTGQGGRHPYTIPHVLRYATAEDIVGLNPHLVQQTVLGYMSSLTMAWLTKFDLHNQPVPELTTEVPTEENGGISKDGSTITWHLRKGVKWSDGVPFTADDVVFSTKAVLNPKNNEVGRDGWDLITKIDEPDKYTVVFHMKKRYAAYASTFFGSAGANPCVLPAHLLANLPTINDAPYNALPVGIGPFKYQSWKRADSVTMVPNPYYFRGQPKLQKIIFKIVPDRNTVLTQLQSHEIDLWTPVTFAYVDRVKAIPGVVLDRKPSYYFDHLDFQNTHPPLDDVRVRRALRMGIDRDEIKEKLHHGIGVVQDDPISPAHPTFDKAVPTTKFDLDAAGKLLDEAGWTMGPNNLRTKNGKTLTFDYATSTGSPDADQTIELIRANWQKLGVALTVRHYPAPLFFAPMASGGIVYSGKWDMINFGWGGDVVGDISNLYECSQMPPNGQNDPRYCNKKVSDAMEKFKGLYDPKQRQQYSNEIQEGIAADVPIVVLDVREDMYGYNSDLKNLTVNQVSPFDDAMNLDI